MVGIKSIVGFQIDTKFKTEEIQESVNGLHFLRIEFEVSRSYSPFECRPLDFRHILPFSSWNSYQG